MKQLVQIAKFVKLEFELTWLQSLLYIVHSCLTGIKNFLPKSKGKTKSIYLYSDVILSAIPNQREQH